MTISAVFSWRLTSDGQSHSFSLCVMFVSHNPKQKPSVGYAGSAVYMQRAYRLRWLKRWGHRLESRSRHECVSVLLFRLTLCRNRTCNGLNPTKKSSILNEQQVHGFRTELWNVTGQTWLTQSMKLEGEWKKERKKERKKETNKQTNT